MPFATDSAVVDGLASMGCTRVQALVQATADSTLTLNVASLGYILFNGTVAGQILKLGDATTYLVGATYLVHNSSTNPVTIQNNSLGYITALSTNARTTLILEDNSTVAGVWRPSVSGITSGGVINPGGESIFFDEFLTGIITGSADRFSNGNWFYAVSGGGTLGIVAEAGVVGCASLSTGGNSGRVVMIQDPIAMNLGGNTVDIRMRVKVPVLATSAQNFSVEVGLGDTTDGTSFVDGAYFYYDAASAFWVTRTRSNSVENSKTTNVTVVANQWYTLRMVINAAGTAIEFYIGTTSSNMALVTTHTLSIPTGISRACSPIYKIVKTAGSPSRSIYTDYYWMYTLMGAER